MRLKLRDLRWIVLAAGVACSSPTKPAPLPPINEAPPAEPAPPPAGPQAVKVTLADVGLEASSLDRSADPCVDFYQFACGGWLQTNQIPGDRARWGRIPELDEKNKVAVQALLDDDAKGVGGDAAAKKVGEFYASCMDEAAIEKAGTAAIKPALDKIARVHDAATWQAALVELHRLGVPAVWRTSSGPDAKDSKTELTQLDSDGLGLPDRDYYVNPERAKKVDAYRAHVARMLVLAGTPAAKADAAAGTVVAIETELAKVTKTRVEKRDPVDAYNPIDAGGLAKQVKSIEWPAYWKALGFAASAKINLGTPKYFAALDALRAKFPPAQWASYFTYHLVAHDAQALPKAFRDESFALDKELTGQPQPLERNKRCIEITERELGELLGQQYVAKYFPPSSKQTATALVDALVHAMADQLAQQDWMTAATRQTALAKLGKIARMIGYPDKWRTYDFDVRRDDFAGNLLRADAFEAHRDRAKSGGPVDRSEWQMNAYTVNAYYEPTANETALPAGILQAPFFGQDRAVAANLGGIGMVIGHELTHGFDDEGAKYDADGNLVQWWQDADKAKFEAKGTCVADQYSTFEAQPKAFVNGRLTLGENIADLGGVKMAFHAYRALRKDAPKMYVADGFTEDQQFFIAVGQAWCAKDRPEEIQRRLTIDPHSPPKFRVYGALRNLPEFARAFQCAAGTPMNPAQPCAVW
ncbi:MAG TPA: M13 family metallopeptidase [Kofleriaceae bacterium]|nr:M13 family metallopeptidase [Kofleriaceae bacterium]